MDPGLVVGVAVAVAVDRVIDRVVAAGGAAVRDAISVASRVEAPLRSDEVAKVAGDVLVGLGPIAELLDEPSVTDVLVNAAEEIWVERDGHLVRTGLAFPSTDALLAAIERVLLPLGLRLDRQSPAVDARLPDGSRFHAVVPPAAVDGPVVAIRRFRPTIREPGHLLDAGAIDGEGLAVLERLVAERRNIVVSGPTGAGKTTLLNVLSRFIPESDRVIVIEEAAELSLIGHVVRLEGRPPNAEGAGAITVRSLVRQALRMRPDRIVVGEVRGPEALDLLHAMTTGHAGSMGTVHASDPEEALWRIETLAAMAPEAVPHRALHRLLFGAVESIVQVERRGGLRRVAGIARVSGDGVEVEWSR